jgi:predicted SAM-dependent methyltransferase
MELNLGSDEVTFPGFKNVDIRDVAGVDIVDDVSKMTKFEDESVDNIIANNILEHFAPDRTLDILKLWVSKLKKGGTIVIGVPDGEFIYDRYLNDETWKGNWDKVVHSMFGNMEILRRWHGDEAELYGHHTIFSKDYLKRFMLKAGLKDIKDNAPSHADAFSLKGVKE